MSMPLTYYMGFGASLMIIFGVCGCIFGKVGEVE
jgi:hypothetical protein